MYPDIFGIIAIVAGVALILFSTPFAKESMNFQNKAFGFKFGEREVKGTTWIAIIIGSLVVLYGILSLFGIKLDI